MKKNIDQIIEEAFKTEPTFELGAGFKDRVSKMIKRKELKSQRKFYFFISLGVVMMFAAGAALVQYFGSIKSLSQFDQIVPFAIMVGGLIAVIQYLDKKLVKDKYIKQLT